MKKLNTNSLGGGLSGVYKLTNKNEPGFYIGSSNNLARRMDEYIKLKVYVIYNQENWKFIKLWLPYVYNSYILLHLNYL